MTDAPDPSPTIGDFPRRFENPYYVATMAENREDQLAALLQFSTEEAEDRFERVEELGPSGESIPEENREEWSYEKGYLDACRTFMMLHSSVFMRYKMLSSVEDDVDE